jgi:hypothetical protein
MDDTKTEGVGLPVSGTVESVSATRNSPEDKVEALRHIGVFADLPEDQLQWFADNVEERRLAPGDVVFRKGDPADWLVIFLEGEMLLLG